MATREAIAIRTERGMERLRAALGRLQAEAGVPIKRIELQEKDTLSRMAELSEKLADSVESLLKVMVSDDFDEIEDDGNVDEIYVEEPEPEDVPGDAPDDAPDDEPEPEPEPPAVQRQPGDIVPITADELEEVDSLEEEDDGDINKRASSKATGSSLEKSKASGSSSRRK